MPVAGDRTAVAIVGMGCLFPGAPDLASFWANLRDGVDAISEVPPARLDPVFFDRAVPAADRFYCRRGGFVDALARFDPASFGVMPKSVPAAEPDQFVALAVAAAALEDAGYDKRPFARERTAVILGRGGYAGPGKTRLDARVRGTEQTLAVVRALVPGLDDVVLARLKSELQAQFGDDLDDGAIGLVPNLAASRIANRLDLHGPAYTVDAACASALVAVDHATRELESGRCDLVLTGGVYIGHDEAFWSVFTQLGALSRSERIRPFDRRADGLLIGEGAGIVALKRLADAERDGDRIYAVIRGTGLASDGRGGTLMSPAVEGQQLALEAAWAAAGLDPASVAFVEAHGTGTPAGDAAELETLAKFFGQAERESERATVGSVKSMIGHTMPAAGAAGLIKAALGLYHGALLPTLHCDEPREALRDTRFRVLAQAESIAQPARAIAGINAFGFGGINAHVVLQAHDLNVSGEKWSAVPVSGGSSAVNASGASRVAGIASASSVISANGAAGAEGAHSANEAHSAKMSNNLASSETLLSGFGLGEISVFSAATATELLHDLAFGEQRLDGGPVRLVVLGALSEKRERAQAIVERGKPWRGRDEIWFSPDGLLAQGGRLAFVYPGVDAEFAPRIDDVARAVGRTVPVVADPENIELLGRGVFEVNRIVDRALRACGVAPSDACGHSLGEWNGMLGSGIVSEADIETLMAQLGEGWLEVPGVVFAAAGCGLDRAREAISDISGIEVSHDNCPHQTLLCGIEAAVDIALDRLRALGVIAQKLPFRSGFHSTFFEPYIATHVALWNGVPMSAPRERMWSATTASPYPRDAAAIRELAVRHLVEPVRFRETIEAMYNAGVRVFVQAGAGSATNFIDDTLRGRAFVSIPANVKARSGAEQLRRVLAGLFIEGADIDPRGSTANAGAATDLPSRARRAGAALALGVPLARKFTPLPSAPPPHIGAALGSSDGALGHPLAAEFSRGLDAVAAAQREVLAHLTRSFVDSPHRSQTAQSPPAAQAAAAPQTSPTPPPLLQPVERWSARTLSLETLPELADHAFMHQPPGWPAEDARPTVPMTATIDIMIEHALAAAPGTVAVAIEGVRALKWMLVDRPLEVRIRTRYDGDSRVEVLVDGFAEATVIVGRAYPEPPREDRAPLRDARASEPGEAREVYGKRYMFHGPRYQGIAEIEEFGEDGIRGRLIALPARGELLDNGGQLLGYWIMRRYVEDRVVLPIGVERIMFFAPHPEVGAQIRCTARIRTFDEKSFIVDVDFASNEGLWARASGWTVRRFGYDERLFKATRRPETCGLSEIARPGFAIYDDSYTSAITREQVVWRYLDRAEERVYANKGPRMQRAWLNGRIALKDAVRSVLWNEGVASVYPIEVPTYNLDSGAPAVRLSDGSHLFVSLAHKREVAVAVAARSGPVGVDVETIERRSENFIETAFTPAELALIDGLPRDEWLTRLWTAKEAAAKRHGTGLGGDPRHWSATERDDERFYFSNGEVWTRTARRGDVALGWTE